MPFLYETLQNPGWELLQSAPETWDVGKDSCGTSLDTTRGSRHRTEPAAWPHGQNADAQGVLDVPVEVFESDKHLAGFDLSGVHLVLFGLSRGPKAVQPSDSIAWERGCTTRLRKAAKTGILHTPYNQLHKTYSTQRSARQSNKFQSVHLILRCEKSLVQKPVECIGSRIPQPKPES